MAIFPEIDIHTATIEELVSLCSSPSRQTIGEQPLGSSKMIVKISEKVVIKSGMSVTESEANNQRVAYLLLDPNFVHVPQVYRFFRKGDRGYIVMEYIKGEVLVPLEDPKRIRRVARAVAHIHKISSPVPGPPRAGVPHGLLWSEYEDLCFRSISDVEMYFNTRLVKESTLLSFGPCNLVFCHLDIAPRNIVWLENGAMCLLDWECAGFYPRILEICAQRAIAGKDGNFNMMLLNQMGELTEEEELQSKLILKAFSNEQRYHL